MKRIQYLLLGVITSMNIGLFAADEAVTQFENRRIETAKAICESLSQKMRSHSSNDKCPKPCGKHSKKVLGPCGCERPITKKDIGSSGYVITKPGTYRLVDDVEFSPTLQNLAAIQINSDDVLLDLCNHRLSQGNPVINTRGIVVGGKTNVTIQNGTVSNFSEAGIDVDPESSYITIRYINALQNGRDDSTLDVGGGIVITSALPDAVTHDILIDHVNASENHLAGLILSGVTDVVVTHSKFNNNLNDTTGFGSNSWGILASAFYLDPQGPSFLPVRNLQIIESEMNNNTSVGGAIGLEVLSVPTFGFAFNSNVSILRCSANDNVGGGSSTAVNEGEGIVVIGTQNFLIKDSVAKRNASAATAPSGQDGFFASVGFGVAFAGLNGVIDGCVAEGNTGAGDISAGFRVARSDNITVTNCIAIGNNNTSSGEAWGFTTDTNLNNTAGIFGPSVNNNFIFINNVAEANVSESGLSGGFKFISVVESELSNNRSVANGGYGILVGDPACCATVSCPGSCTPNCCPTFHNVINNNEVIGNDLVGIADQSNASADNAYFANIARGNGTNYVLPPGTPIRLWPLPAGPNPVDNFGVLDAQLDNISITP